MVPASEPRTSRAFGPWFICAQGIAYILFSTILRVVLAVRYRPDSSSLGLPEDALPAITFSAWIRVFGTGLLLDALVAAFVFLPFVLWLTFLPPRWERRWQRLLLGGAAWCWWVLALFLFQGEYLFYGEYNSRYNTVAIDYLHYWTEVSANVAEMYPWKTIVAISLVGAAAVVGTVWRLAQPIARPPFMRRLAGFGIWSTASALLVWGASLVNYQASSERVMNELSSNGLTSGAIALWTRELDYAHFFPTLPREDAYTRARQLLDSPGAVWSDDPYSLQRRIPGDLNRKKLNVIVLLEESFGSEFWGCLNGVSPKKSLTPQLDELAQSEGMLFTNLFADGNRTIRGIEAVLASFPPLPGDSLVARPKAHGCETIATTLGRDGYATTFVYPGRGAFDGLGRFTLANGFSRFIEQKDFADPVFTNTWGHCNEDLYDRVLTEARAEHASGRPFLITALSITNHQPFTYPDGRIPEPSGKHSRKFAVKYVDYALGRFFKAAKKEPFWNDTIFVVVADHGARVYGSQTVPILSYEIPILILGPAVVNHPARIATLGCQLDVAPTILGLIGRPYDSVFYGRDLLVPATSRFALLNHNRSVALYREPELVALSLGKVVERFTRSNRTTLVRQPLDSITEETSRDATALLQTADELYSQRRYAVQVSATPERRIARQTNAPSSVSNEEVAPNK